MGNENAPPLFSCLYLTLYKLLPRRANSRPGEAAEVRLYSSFFPSAEWLLNSRSAYFHSTATLNYIRGLLTSGFASLHHPRDWSLLHVRSPSLRYVWK